MNAAVNKCSGDTGEILNCTYLPDTLVLHAVSLQQGKRWGKAGDVVYLAECLPGIPEALDFMFRTS